MKKIKFILILCLLLFCFNFNTSLANEETNELTYTQEELANIIETSAKLESNPEINSRAAVVLDRNSGIVLYGKNMDQRKPMASTTKIMTCIVAIEKGNLSDIVTVGKAAASVGGSGLGIKIGDKISLNDLLYGLMLESRKRLCRANWRTYCRKQRRFCRFNERKG